VTSSFSQRCTLVQWIIRRSHVKTGHSSVTLLQTRHSVLYSTLYNVQLLSVKTVMSSRARPGSCWSSCSSSYGNTLLLQAGMIEIWCSHSSVAVILRPIDWWSYRRFERTWTDYLTLKALRSIETSVNISRHDIKIHKYWIFRVLIILFIAHTPVPGICVRISHKT
jgi:hypothetical protein